MFLLSSTHGVFCRCIVDSHGIGMHAGSEAVQPGDVIHNSKQKSRPGTAVRPGVGEHDEAADARQEQDSLSAAEECIQDGLKQVRPLITVCFNQQCELTKESNECTLVSNGLQALGRMNAVPRAHR